jgi:Zn-dependent protease/predicted transcriptional regulator
MVSDKAGTEAVSPIGGISRGNGLTMSGSLHLGRIAGISLEINYSWLIILVLLTVSLAVSWFPQAAPSYPPGTYWGLGFLAAVLLFVAVLMHELAHSLVARARGLPVKSITLFIFGGISDLEQDPASPGVEFQVTIVGPVSSLIIAAVCWGSALALRGVPLIGAVFGYLAIANGLLAFFNLIPGFPLDGGRVLRAILWKLTGSLRTATRWATRVSQVIAFLFILVGIWLFFSGNLLGGLWLGFIGWFLLGTAQAANAQVMLETLFGRVTVGEVMNPVPLTVSPGLSLLDLVEQSLLPRSLRAVCVTQDNSLVGLVSLTEIRQVPRAQWQQIPVWQVMVPRNRLLVAAPQQRLSEAMGIMAQRNIHQLPVVQDERLVGMVSRETIIRFLEVRRGLGLEEAEAQVEEQLRKAG